MRELCGGQQSAASPTTLAGAWAWLLNALNAADLALHAGYACLLALLVWRLVQPLAARLALLAGERIGLFTCLNAVILQTQYWRVLSLDDSLAVYKVALCPAWRCAEWSPLIHVSCLDARLAPAAGYFALWKASTLRWQNMLLKLCTASCCVLRLAQLLSAKLAPFATAHIILVSLC